MEESERSQSLLSSPVSDIIEQHPLKKPYLSSLFIDYDHEEWVPLVQKMKRHYAKILIKRGDKLYLRKGTKLYHGDLSYPFVPGSKSTGNKNKITFFGLDIDISLWYILELARLEHFKKRDNFSRFGCLYLFTLTEDLEIHKLMDLISTNPKDTRICNKMGNVCLHPQVAFRGTPDDSPHIYKLSSEVTLHYPVYESQLSLDSVYLVDPLILEQNKRNRQWNVRNAILKRYQKRNQKWNSLEKDIDIFSETIGPETYIRYYLSQTMATKKKTKKRTQKKNKKTRQKTKPIYSI